MALTRILNEPGDRQEEDAAVVSTCAALEKAMIHSKEIDLGLVEPPVQVERWTLSEPSLRLLIALVKYLRPKHILEFGSGLSTRVLSWALKQADVDCWISSIDHDPQFGLASSNALHGGEDQGRIKIIQAPLVVRSFGGDLYPAYHFDRTHLASAEPADLILADGPPDLLGGRAGTLFQAMDYARPGTLFLLDDANRKTERAALNLWRDVLDNAIEPVNLKTPDERMQAIVIRRPVSPTELANHNTGLTASELRDSIAFESTFILVDDNQWIDQPFIRERRPIPFMEHKGQYWGAAANDSEAIACLERLREAGADYIVIAQPAFWWLEHYREFADHLKRRYPLLLQNRRLIVHRLQAKAS